MTHKKKTPKPAQHLTAERLHDLARKWKRAQSAERAVALFTYSREHGVQYAVFGCDEHLTEIVASGVRLCLAAQRSPMRTFPSLGKTRRRRSPRTSGSASAIGSFLFFKI